MVNMSDNIRRDGKPILGTNAIMVCTWEEWGTIICAEFVRVIMSDWEALSKGTGLGTTRCEAPYEYDIDDGSYIACGEFAVLCFLPGGYRGRWGEWPEDVSFICDEHNEDDRRFPGYYYIKYGAYCTECECPCEKEGEICCQACCDCSGCVDSRAMKYSQGFQPETWRDDG
jgi:hypothetical protein